MKKKFTKCNIIPFISSYTFFIAIILEYIAVSIRIYNVLKQDFNNVLLYIILLLAIILGIVGIYFYKKSFNPSLFLFLNLLIFPITFIHFYIVFFIFV